MKLSPDERKLLDRMRPGVLSRDGFLSTDARPLAEIIDTDRSTVVGLGTTHEALAERLQQVFDAAKDHLGAPVEVGEQLTAVHHEAMGRVPCPWGGCGTFRKGEVGLTDAATGRSLYVTALSIHLIAEHGFYQGRGSRYRLEPEILSHVLHPPASD